MPVIPAQTSHEQAADGFYLPTWAGEGEPAPDVWVPMIDGDFAGKSFIDSEQLGRQDTEALIEQTYRMKEILARNKGMDLLHHHVLVELFFEDSTRTAGSFETAMLRMSGSVKIPNLDHSSMNKGEAYRETITAFGTQADIMVVRHKENGSLATAMNAAGIPVISGGEGDKDHPTQGVLDAFTFHEHFHDLDGLRVTFVGDLAHNRPVKSNAAILSRFEDMTMNFVAPDCSQMQPGTVEKLEGRGVTVNQSRDLKSFLPETDILYAVRPRTERLRKEQPDVYAEVMAAYKNYIISGDNMACLNPRAIVAHPLPCNWGVDLDHSFKADPRAIWNAEMANGVPARMALLNLISGVAIMRVAGEHLPIPSSELAVARQPVLT